MIDGSGVTALHELLDRCGRKRIRVIFSGLQPQPQSVMDAMHLTRHAALLGTTSDFESALDLARSTLAKPPIAPA